MSLTDLKWEVVQDEIWIERMSTGWQKKYKKQLKNKNIKDGAILGTSHYSTPNGNSVYVVVMKRYCGEGCKYAQLCWLSLYEYEGKNGCKRYLQGLFSKVQSTRERGYDYFVVYTEHCVQRFMERGNMTMLDAFNEMRFGVGIEPYDYNGADDEYMFNVGSGVCFAKDHKWGYIATTYIHQGMEHANQLELHKASMKRVMEGSSRIDKYNDDLCKNKYNRILMNLIKQGA